MSNYCSACGCPNKDSWYPSDGDVPLRKYHHKINGSTVMLCISCQKTAPINGYIPKEVMFIVMKEDGYMQTIIGVFTKLPLAQVAAKTALCNEPDSYHSMYIYETAPDPNIMRVNQPSPWEPQKLFGVETKHIARYYKDTKGGLHEDSHV